MGGCGHTQATPFQERIQVYIRAVPLQTPSYSLIPDLCYGQDTSHNDFGGSLNFTFIISHHITPFQKKFQEVHWPNDLSWPGVADHSAFLTAASLLQHPRYDHAVVKTEVVASKTSNSTSFSRAYQNVFHRQLCINRFLALQPYKCQNRTQLYARTASATILILRISKMYPCHQF